MRSQGPDIAALVDELIAALDEQIALLDRRRRQLEALSATILDRDDDRMEKLLAEIERTLAEQSSADQKLQAIRSRLASALACRSEEVRLGRLIESLQGRRRVDLEDRRQQIIVLTSKLRQQHLETCLFLLESSRINRLLLESLFPDSEPVVTYGADGQDQWRPDTGLVDAEL